MDLTVVDGEASHLEEGYVMWLFSLLLHSLPVNLLTSEGLPVFMLVGHCHCVKQQASLEEEEPLWQIQGSQNQGGDFKAVLSTFASN